ncbi:hypothetical protein BDK51DRAFT_41152 [Blyttiomyces helicus]|uniref:Uncharacterized protein n=1 Tax=Blyttiomyces helicus TaxID=388810 RepID=A0A4P9W1G0_9FUNG|nr:hypothetical protein BDK51DRAFT_41152 [Blyttiomyces helicus]|eukprot:RKO86021.1 hypothetical protein BDK51DRAFT_41152 [Blyttiomyces helicus]
MPEGDKERGREGRQLPLIHEAFPGGHDMAKARAGDPAKPGKQSRDSSPADNLESLSAAVEIAFEQLKQHQEHPELSSLKRESPQSDEDDAPPPKRRHRSASPATRWSEAGAASFDAGSHRGGGDADAGGGWPRGRAPMGAGVDGERGDDGGAPDMGNIPRSPDSSTVSVQGVSGTALSRSQGVAEEPYNTFLHTILDTLTPIPSPDSDLTPGDVAGTTPLLADPVTSTRCGASVEPQVPKDESAAIRQLSPAGVRADDLGRTPASASSPRTRVTPIPWAGYPPPPPSPFPA